MKAPTCLYIIGNGFDRYHGLNTSYQSFAIFLKERHRKIYNLLIEYFELPDLDPQNNASSSDPLWGDFENALSSLDFESVLHEKSDYIANPANSDFKSRDWHAYEFEMQLIVDHLTRDLCAAFKQFIRAVAFPETVDNIILDSKGRSAFLNFNYTDTLEEFYHVKRQQILYLHGKARQPKDLIILGHGIDPLTFKEDEKQMPRNLSEEEAAAWLEKMSDEYDYSVESGRSRLLSYFKESFKSTREIIEANRFFFESISNVKEVFVLGHSISSVDQPYFSKVIQSIEFKSATWTISFYTPEEQQSHRRHLLALGLDQKQIELVKMETLRLKMPSLFD